MTSKEAASIMRLRNQGYAVIVWTPEELGNAEARRVEDRSIELGWEVIECLDDKEDSHAVPTM
jgi:hypothetical protein